MTDDLSKNTCLIDLESFTVEQFRERLRNETVRVTFTKADGSERVMHATLLQGIIVPYERKTNREKVRPENIVPVWDMEASAWRSINFDAITQVEVLV